MDFLNDYSTLPASLLDEVSAYQSIVRAPPSCGADTSDCSTDGMCNDHPSCNTDTSDCSSDSSCSRDSPSCSSDTPPCSYDGVCTSDIPVPRPTGTGEITLISVTSTSVKIQLKSIANATRYHVVYRLATETSVQSVDGTSTTVTITGLSPGAEYAINYYGLNSSGNNGFMSSPFYVTTLSSDIEKWNWNASNGNASATATKNAYTAVSNHGSTGSFSYVVWNDMVDKVQDILNSKGLSWNSNFLSNAATKMSSSDKTLTADRFNSLRYNIGLHYSTGIDTVSRGDPVYGWYFTQLTYCMNNWIDDLN